ncbi:MAG: NB-ARC domain-containing protein [Cyanobacteriota bacterium]|nr:NB-ARC domain-containing protein [Cyanobacteriota bacterium]
MDIETVLKWTDRLVFAKTQKHLDSLQEAILKGTWQHQTHAEIAEEYHCSDHHVRKKASELWQLLSDLLGEEIRKSNVRSILEKAAFSHTYFNWGDDSIQIGDIHFCKKNSHYSKVAKKPSTTAKPEQTHDLTEAPATGDLYNRTAELTLLKQWILEENSRIVAVTGLPGIGKTALARQLVEEIQDERDRLLWRNHRQFPNLKSLKTNLVQFLSPHRRTASIADKLRSQRTLIVLDDLQQTFSSGEQVGTYRPDFQNYGQFLQEIAESSHNSCLLLLSREKPKEIDNPHCRALQLGGIKDGAREILASRGLTNQKRWKQLIHLYGGNPSWLKIIAATIEELFNGSVEQFLSCPTVFLGDLEPILLASYRRLSESEKIAIAHLATQPAPVEIVRKPPDFPLSHSAYWKAVQSLTRRFLVEKVTAEGVSKFVVGAAIAQFVKEQNP